MGLNKLTSRWATTALSPWEFLVPSSNSNFALSCSYYGISDKWVDWTSMIYMILYIPLIFPGSWFLDKVVSAGTETNTHIS